MQGRHRKQATIWRLWIQNVSDFILYSTNVYIDLPEYWNDGYLV